MVKALAAGALTRIAYFQDVGAGRFTPSRAFQGSRESFELSAKWDTLLGDACGAFGVRARVAILFLTSHIALYDYKNGDLLYR